ncbi:MAG: metal ABC transporter permease [Phycisphaeraceae bacterium]|nr:metal ABC transporter permease [Phycisphaeraceae bacterium]
MSFFHDMEVNPFLLNGLLAGLLASFCCGMIGPYVITRRIVFLSGSIAHMAFGGIGAGIYLAASREGATREMVRQGALWGALIAAVLGALLICLIAQRARERLDTLIGALWAIGMSIGILLLKYTDGYYADAMSYLFGSIVYVPDQQINFMIVIALVILLTVLLMHKRILAVCIDEQQAQLQGIRVGVVNLILLILVAMVVVSLMQVVGLILVLALLTLPAATAGHHVTRMVPMMVIACLLCILLTTGPRIAVYGTRIGPEGATVLAAGAVYLLSLGLKNPIARLLGRVRGRWGRA